MKKVFHERHRTLVGIRDSREILAQQGLQLPVKQHRAKIKNQVHALQASIEISDKALYSAFRSRARSPTGEVRASSTLGVACQFDLGRCVPVRPWALRARPHSGESPAPPGTPIRYRVGCQTPETVP